MSKVSDTPTVMCPAGQPVQGTGITPGPGIKAQPGGCLCPIEGQMITKGERHFWVACKTSNYTMCPSWRTAKKRNWKDRVSDVARARRESIERLGHGHDPVADAVLAGEAPLEEMLSS